MKNHIPSIIKSLACLFVVSSTLASAQSANVTLYGLVDAYVGRVGGAVAGASIADKSTTKV